TKTIRSLVDVAVPDANVFGVAVVVAFIVGSTVGAAVVEAEVVGCIVDVGEVTETEIAVATGAAVETGGVGVVPDLLIKATITVPLTPTIATAIGTHHPLDSLSFEVAFGLRLPEPIRTFIILNNACLRGELYYIV